MNIRLSVNRHIIGKDISAIARHNDGYVNMTLTLDEVAGAIQLGWAIAHVLKGPRRAENVVSAEFLAVDIDDGLTIEETLADPFTQAHAGLLYTTVSHTSAQHRFRIFFPLQVALTSREDIRLAQVGLAARYGGDLAATDAPRLFAGSKDCRLEMIGMSLPPDEVEKLIQHGREKIQSRRLSVSTGVRGSVRSRNSVPVDLKVRVANGEERYLYDLNPRTRVHCPNHADKRASAVTVLSSGGKPGIFCSTCQVTMFPDAPQANDGQLTYSSLGLVDLLKDTTTYGTDSPLAVYRDPSLRRLHERFLQDVIPRPEWISKRARASEASFDLDADHPPPGLWVESHLLGIVSAKGTGKTHDLKRYIGELLRLNASVLLVGSRRVLLAEQSAKLGLTNYLKDDGTSFNWPTQGYAICLDSLPRLKPGEHRYDVVVIDESQSVYEHLQSDTLKTARRRVLQHLRYYMRQAKQVILLDADLGRLTLEMTGEMLRGLDRSSRFIVNEWKASDAVIDIYEDLYSPRQAVGDIIKALNAGEKCMVCCNSKSDAEVIASEAPRHVHDRALKVMCITANNSGDPAVQEFIKNIRTQMAQYDLVVVSPSMSSGVDITFPDDVKLFRVFGVFHPLVTTHFEIDQQLGRVRHPLTVSVWISPEEFSFECDPHVIQAEIWAAEADHHIWLGTSDDGSDQFQADPLSDLSYVAVAAHRRGAFNALRRNFIEHKQANGWSVNRIALDPELARIGAGALKEGKESQKADHRQRVLSAPKILAAEYQELRWQKKFKQLTAGAEYQMRRFEVESFYDQDVTDDLLAFDDEGRGRRAVRNLYALTASDAEIQALEEKDRRSLEADRMQWGYRREVLSTLLTAAGLLKGGALQTSAEVNLPLLGAFVRALAAEHMKAALQRLFGLAPRRDSDQKPVRQLVEVLKVLRLRLIKSSRSRKGGADQVSFRLDESSVMQVMGHVERRRLRGGIIDALEG